MTLRPLSNAPVTGRGKWRGGEGGLVCNLLGQFNGLPVKVIQPTKQVASNGRPSPCTVCIHTGQRIHASEAQVGAFSFQVANCFQGMVQAAGKRGSARAQLPLHERSSTFLLEQTAASRRSQNSCLTRQSLVVPQPTTPVMLTGSRRTHTHTPCGHPVRPQYWLTAQLVVQPGVGSALLCRNNRHPPPALANPRYSHKYGNTV